MRTFLASTLMERVLSGALSREDAWVELALAKADLARLGQKRQIDQTLGRDATRIEGDWGRLGLEVAAATVFLESGQHEGAA